MNQQQQTSISQRCEPTSERRLGVILICALPVIWQSSLGVARATDSVAPLADAVQQKDTSGVKLLLQMGANVNAAQADGMTALHWAAYLDKPLPVKWLIEHKANINVTNRYGVSPLTLACRNGSRPIVQQLLDAGADPQTVLRGGETALMTAARTGRIGPVKALLKAGAAVNARDDNDQTAVMWAAAEGHTKVVEALIEAGADFLTPLPSGFTPLFFAVREGRTDVVKLLLERGADVNEVLKPRSRGRREHTTALLLAVENGHFETAEALLQAGADPNAAPAGYTALHAITWVRRPLLGDTDPAPIGSGKISSLDFVRLLLKSGADINARYDQESLNGGGRYNGGDAQFVKAGATTFLLAARNSDLPLMQLLLDSGADWTIPNAIDCTALLAAAGVGALGSGDELPGTEAEAIEAVRRLLERGADINDVTQTGETAIHGAAYQERPQLIRFLTEQGADADLWNRKNKFNWTPLLIARGYRPGNFRPSPKTITAVEEVMQSANLPIPPAELPSETPQR